MDKAEGKSLFKVKGRSLYSPCKTYKVECTCEMHIGETVTNG